MVRWIVSALLVWTFFDTSAAAQTDKPYLVELAVFTCPHCKALQARNTAFKRAYGDRFVFAPLPFESGSNLGARLYYALRDQVDESELRQSIFVMLQDMRMSPSDPEEIIQFMRVRGMRFDEDLAKSDLFGPKVDGAIERAKQLAQRAGVTSVPAIVKTTRSGSILETFERRENEGMSAFVARVLKK